MSSRDRSDERHPIARAFEEVTPIEQALQAGVRRALREHALLGRSVVEWRDGRVVRVSPEEILRRQAANAKPGSRG